MTATDVNMVIDKLCEKLELPVKHGFEYVCAFGITDLIYCAIFGFMFVFSLCVICWSIRRDLKDMNTDASDAAGIVCSFIAIFSGVGLFVFLPFAMLYLYNPQAWALRYLLQRL